ncbi:MAG TPA: hypothetical protein VK053_07140 [Jiangellaceae bacterium]|nr:hypothetical protein [Jiangellaceae bacterium]
MSLRRRRCRRRARISEARAALEQAERERPEVERLVMDLHARGDRNHFAPMFEEALKRRRSS